MIFQYIFCKSSIAKHTSKVEFEDEHLRIVENPVI
jgi:hypothetical protein